tara:strand:- start:3593 stop:3790 length:198 start_codon:yes stop_codon:yes gene_type:complete
MSGENISVTGNNDSKNGKTDIKPKVDINILLNKVRAEKKKEKNENIIFFALISLLIVTTGIIVSL